MVATMRSSLPLALLGAAVSVWAQSSSSSETSTVVEDTEVETATPSPTGSADALLPSQSALPPAQAWCPSEIFCAGEILQTINVAWPYTDSKTIVDKPTNGSAEEIVEQFERFSADGVTFGEVTTFLESHFQGEGLELAAVSIPNFPESPRAFADIPDQYVKGFTMAVHNIWNLLIRDTNETTLCTGGRCESSLIPLNHTFVVPGGRFREQYYWDSKFILHGLLESELNEIAKNTLENFMDEIDQFGFIPNGGRIYYLNRSQPPVFITMVKTYVDRTGDSSILGRALPIMEKELEWWETNRTISVTSPYTNTTYDVARYAVVNSAPRPESYREDYETANGHDAPDYTEEQKGALYAELASGAESGWDYSSRWETDPFAAGGNHTYQLPGLRTLNVRGTIPVDLNAILYKARIDLASMYTSPGNARAKRVIRRQDAERAEAHREAAATLRSAILDLMWDGTKLAFYDFNTTSNARNGQFTAAHWYPLWANIIPEEVTESQENAFGAFSSLSFALRRFNGTYPATWVETGLQWDFPNSWPPHIYFALEALKNIPDNVANGPLPQSNNSFSLIPEGQLGLTADTVPLQTIGGGETTTNVDLNSVNGTVTNGGRPVQGEGWAKQLERELANRYMASVYCSWYATGGSLPGLLARLPDETLNLTQSLDQEGHLFEKFSALDIDSAGRGGEYAVQAGFGWTNGVALWIAANYKEILTAPICPNITAEDVGLSSESKGIASVRAGLGAALVGVFVGLVALV